MIHRERTQFLHAAHPLGESGMEHSAKACKAIQQMSEQVAEV
jgi:hypothetical protein